MTESDNLRGYRRQQLIEEIMRKAYQKEDELGQSESVPSEFLLDLAQVTIGYLKWCLTDKPFDVTSDVGLFFKNEIVPSILAFGPSKAELDHLAVTLLKKILDSALSPFQTELLYEDILEINSV